jgi:hypothetical protein
MGAYKKATGCMASTDGSTILTRLDHDTKDASVKSTSPAGHISLDNTLTVDIASSGLEKLPIKYLVIFEKLKLFQTVRRI